MSRIGFTRILLHSGDSFAACRPMIYWPTPHRHSPARLCSATSPAMPAEELHARMKACAMAWKETGDILDAERRERVRQTETIFSSDALDDASSPDGTVGTERCGRTFNPANGTVAIDIGGTATSQFGLLTTSGAATLDGMLSLALVNGFSPALGNSFPVMTFGSRTGQFATINGLAIGNGKQFSPAYTATNLTLNVTAAAPIPAMPDSDGRGGGGESWGLAMGERHPRRAGTPRPFDPFDAAQGIRSAQGTRGTDPRDPASVLRITHLERSATGMQMQFPTKPGKTYRLEYTDDLKTPWQLLKDNIPGTGASVTIPDPSAQTIPQRFYRLVVTGQ